MKVENNSNIRDTVSKTYITDITNLEAIRRQHISIGRINLTH